MPDPTDTTGRSTPEEPAVGSGTGSTLDKPPPKRAKIANINVNGEPDVRSSESRVRLHAAVDLSKAALLFLPVFVIFLLGILLIVEGWQHSVIATLNQSALTQISKPSERPLMTEIDQVLADLGEPAPRNPAIAGHLRQIARDRLTPADQGQVLGNCATAFDGPDLKPGDVIVQICKSTLASVRAKLESECPDCDFRRITELTKIAEKARSTFRAQWLQIAQLVLLNLMLPLLTGLFGFLFGRETALNDKAAGDL